MSSMLGAGMLRPLQATNKDVINVGSFLRARCGSLHQAYTALDTFNCGHLTGDSFAQGMGRLGFKEDTTRIFRTLDTSSTGMVTMNQFMRAFEQGVTDDDDEGSLLTTTHSLVSSHSANSASPAGRLPEADHLRTPLNQSRGGVAGNLPYGVPPPKATQVGAPKAAAALSPDVAERLSRLEEQLTQERAWRKRHFDDHFTKLQTQVTAIETAGAEWRDGVGLQARIDIAIDSRMQDLRAEIAASDKSALVRAEYAADLASKANQMCAQLENKITKAFANSDGGPFCSVTTMEGLLRPQIDAALREMRLTLEEFQNRATERAQVLGQTLGQEFERSTVNQAIAEARAEAFATCSKEIDNWRSEIAQIEGIVKGSAAKSEDQRREALLMSTKLQNEMTSIRAEVQEIASQVNSGRIAGGVINSSGAALRASSPPLSSPPPFSSMHQRTEALPSARAISPVREVSIPTMSARSPIRETSPETSPCEAPSVPPPPHQVSGVFKYGKSPEIPTRSTLEGRKLVSGGSMTVPPASGIAGCGGSSSMCGGSISARGMPSSSPPAPLGGVGTEGYPPVSYGDTLSDREMQSARAAAAAASGATREVHPSSSPSGAGTSTSAASESASIVSGGEPSGEVLMAIKALREDVMRLHDAQERDGTRAPLPQTSRVPRTSASSFQSDRQAQLSASLRTPRLDPTPATGHSNASSQASRSSAAPSASRSSQSSQLPVNRMNFAPSRLAGTATGNRGPSATPARHPGMYPIPDGRTVAAGTSHSPQIGGAYRG